MKSDNFLVMAHGGAAEIARAKTILGAADPSRLDVHAGANATTPAHDLVSADG